MERIFQNGVPRNAGWLITCNIMAASKPLGKYFGSDNFGLTYAYAYA